MTLGQIWLQSSGDLAGRNLTRCLSDVLLGQSEREMQALDIRLICRFSEMFFFSLVFCDGVDIVMAQMTS